MSIKPTLSYVMTTYNKLDYLKLVLPDLINSKQIDEEIIIIDGGSKDGTQEYLESYIASGQIDIFVSSKDKGEAHGFNKGFLLAGGDLIKVISDDDIFDFDVISSCKKYMLMHTELDALVGENMTTTSADLTPPIPNPEMREEFNKWTNGTNKSFYCNGLPLLIRRSSLSILGLFNVEYLCVDLEYTIRTSRIGNYAFCTLPMVTRIINLQSNGAKYVQRCIIEQKRLCDHYGYPTPETWKEVEPMTLSIISRVKRKITRTVLGNKNPEDREMLTKQLNLPPDLKELYDYHKTYLKEFNKDRTPQFITRKTHTL